MFDRDNSSNKQETNGCSFKHVLQQHLSLFLPWKGKWFFPRGFNLKPTKIS